MDPVKKAIWQTIFRWLAGIGGGSAGLTGGLDLIALTVAGLPLAVLLGVLSSLATLGLGILDKIPDRPARCEDPAL